MMADRSATRHRAERRAAGPGRTPPRRQLIALAVLPAAAAALLAALAVLVLARGARLHALGGRSAVALCALGGLVLLVLLAGALWARSVWARTSAAPGYAPPLPPGPQDAAEASAITDFPAPPARGREQPAREYGHEYGREPVVGRGAAADNGVFVHLSQRLQSLVHRQIELLDGLENEVEEPDLLKGLFSVDHLATRMRRHAENLAVLGGTVPRRQWTRPVSVMEVLRSAVSETLDYARVQVIARAPDFLNGYAVADVIHLLAELVENASSFSPPDTKVVLRAHPVTAGLAVEIDDRGLGMPQEEYDRLNALLREPAEVSVRELLEGARIGLYVVAQLARRHNIAIQLQSNITGGTQALVVLPKTLLASTESRTLDRSRRERAAAEASQDPQAQEHTQALPGVVPAPLAAQSVPFDASRTERPAPGAAYGIDGALPGPRRPATGEAAAGTAAGMGTGHMPLRPAAPRPPAQLPPPAQPPMTAGQPMTAEPPTTTAQPAPPARPIAPAPPMPARQAAPPSAPVIPLAPDASSRPPLPRRRPQEHLAAPLLESGPDPAGRVGEEPTPTLLADFRRGLARGAAAPPPGPGAPPAENVYTQEGDR